MYSLLIGTNNSTTNRTCQNWNWDIFMNINVIKSIAYRCNLMGATVFSLCETSDKFQHQTGWQTLKFAAQRTGCAVRHDL